MANPFLLVWTILIPCYFAQEAITVLGFEEMPLGTLIDGLNTDEISGITYDSSQGIYWAIIDNLVPNKGFLGFDFTPDQFTGFAYDLSVGHQMDASDEKPPQFMDSESIVWIENDANSSFFIVGQEGHQVYDADNELYLYSYNTNGNGSTEYVKTMSSQLDDLFVINNTFNNKGVESLSIDETNTYIVYSTEQPLRSDAAVCSNCLRISVNEFSIENTSDVVFNQLYQLRYDMDVFGDTVENGLSDMAIYHSSNGDLVGLFLERTIEENNNIFTFDTRIYSAVLVGDDVSSCASFADDACKDIVGIEKTLVLNASDSSNYVGPLAAVGSQIGFLNFETLSILYNEVDGGVYTASGDGQVINLLMIVDNGGIVNTPFVYLQYDEAAANTIIETTMQTTAMGTTVDEADGAVWFKSSLWFVSLMITTAILK